MFRYGTGRHGGTWDAKAAHLVLFSAVFKTHLGLLFDDAFVCFFGGYSHSSEYIIHIGDYHNPSAGILIDQPG